MSPRRSSRARATQPSANTNGSSSESVASNRQDHPSRMPSERDGQMKSATPQSSSEEPERSQPPEPETRQTRRQKREQDTLDGSNDKSVEDEIDEEDIDEEEVTRCICGQPEYPGPPVPLNMETSRSSQGKDNARATSQTAPESLPEDAGSLFIQCDECHVWQHGGCVGIMDEATSPDNYYCEECRSDLHKLMVGAKGQKYSRYLPVYEALHSKTPRRPSVLISKDSFSRSSKEADIPGGTAAAAMAMSSAKRRSTMNSRAAVDEEEAFLKAIEESKSDGTSGNGIRKTKRGRDDSSEETKQDLKRRKTGSESESPTPVQIESTAPLSDSEAPTSLRGNTGSGRRKGRGVVGTGNRERETREREKEKERERTEAAGRRKGRAETRRTDEPESLEEQTRATGLSRTQANTKQPKLQVPSKPTSAPAPSSSGTAQRKGVKSAARRGRVGRNQYTRDRDAAMESKGGSPQAPNSRDSEDVGNSDGHGGNTLINGTKPSKPRHMNPNRTSMNDLRKRAAGILEYITRTQVEMAGEKTPPHQDEPSLDPSSNGPKTRAGSGVTPSANGASKLSNQVDGSEEHGEEKKEAVERVDETEFKELTSLQMMDVLTRELVLWQKDYGKWGEK